MNLFNTVEQLPISEHFPTNVVSPKTLKLLKQDLQTSSNYTIITGYSSLEFLVETIGGQYDTNRDNQNLIIVLGNEPIYSEIQRQKVYKKTPLTEEIKDYWLEKGISPNQCGTVIQLIHLIETGKVRFKILDGLHAKIYVGDNYALLGSSNFSKSGLSFQKEANIRVDHKDINYQQIKKIAHYYDGEATDYNTKIIELLKKLLHFVSWQEALGRAVSEMIEGDWLKQYPRIFDTLSNLNAPLWPTQIEAIGQALYILDNQGSVLIAEPTGSGKTRIGVGLYLCMMNRNWLRGRSISNMNTLLICPPQVINSWQKEFKSLGSDFCNILSQGKLKNATSNSNDAKEANTIAIEETLNTATESESTENTDPLKNHKILEEIKNAKILFIDEAHNFLNSTSQRSRQIELNSADSLVLYTATPINKKVEDLFRLIEILDIDNLTDEAIKTYENLYNIVKKGRNIPNKDVDLLRNYIREFIIRRTKKELNKKIDAQPELYKNAHGICCRYPKQVCGVYTLDEPQNDIVIAQKINELAAQLVGIIFLRKIYLKPEQQSEPQRWIDARLNSAKALSLYNIQAMLRSSNAALFEHLKGTSAAKKHYDLYSMKGDKKTGNIIEKFDDYSLSLPDIQLGNVSNSYLPTWLTDLDAYQEKCGQEKQIYGKIANWVLQLSDNREQKKAHFLMELLKTHSLILAFDTRLISLHYLNKLIRAKNGKVLLVTGDNSNKKKATDAFELGSREKKLIGLFSDALSEGVNLQQASAIVLLDTPSVMRIAEQRIGRIDRMNSPHPEIKIYFSNDHSEFALKTDRKFFKTAVAVDSMIGGNLDLPLELYEKWNVEMFTGNTFSQLYEAERAIAEARFEDGIQDAFQPIKDLVFGQQPIITEDLYQSVKMSKATFVSKVEISMVHSTQNWAFFCIRGTSFYAPYWLYIHETGEKKTQLLKNLPKICKELRQKLSNVSDLQIENQSKLLQTNLNFFLKEIKQKEIESLPNKKRRALTILSELIHYYLKKPADMERRNVLTEFKKLLNPNSEEEYSIDFYELAHHWITFIQPTLMLKKQEKGKKNIIHLKILLNYFKSNPISTEAFNQLKEHIKIIPSIEKRIASCIIGLRT